MLFNSFEYLIFLPLVCAAYFWLNSNRSQLWLLFLASCFFYGFFIPKYLLILFLVIAIDYYAAIKIESSDRPKVRKAFLVLSLIANLSILCFFKYFNFFIANVNDVATALHWNYSINALNIILPIGLSFHTFQSMAYVFEVYQSRFKAERNLLRYSVYVLYFPQLVAGPIERPQNIIPQFYYRHAFDEPREVSGLYLILQGLFKKVVVADNLAALANAVFNHPSQYGMMATLLGVIAFSFQIYCDFSGYSDIARGSSRILGVELMLNFNKPYFAKSVSEFWRRWHISLSTWFRDYVYIPLGGNRSGKWKTHFNLLAVFSLSGLWHGANWTFIIWGTLHGLYLIFENGVLKPLGQERWPKWVSHTYVFILVAVTWIFFRAPNIHQAIATLNGFFTSPLLGFDSLPPFMVYESIILIAALLFLEAFDERVPFWENLRAQKSWVRWVAYWAMVLVFLFTAQFSGAQFIYFQF